MASAVPVVVDWGDSPFFRYQRIPSEFYSLPAEEELDLHVDSDRRLWFKPALPFWDRVRGWLGAKLPWWGRAARAEAWKQVTLDRYWPFMRAGEVWWRPRSGGDRAEIVNPSQGYLTDIALGEDMWAFDVGTYLEVFVRS